VEALRSVPSRERIEAVRAASCDDRGADLLGMDGGYLMDGFREVRLLLDYGRYSGEPAGSA